MPSEGIWKWVKCIVTEKNINEAPAKARTMKIFRDC